MSHALKNMSKKHKKVIDLTENGDKTQPSSSTRNLEPESRDRNNVILDLTDEDEIMQCSLPVISQQNENLVESHNVAIDLTDDNKEICALTSRLPEPDEALPSFKPSQAATSSLRNDLQSKKLVPMPAELELSNTIDYSEYSKINETCHESKSKNKHIGENTRLALNLLLSTLKNESPAVYSQKQNDIQFNVDVFTEVPHSEDSKRNNASLDANDKTTIAKKISKCKKQDLQPKAIKNQNIDFQIEKTDTEMLKRKQNIEKNKIDFKKNANLEGMIIMRIKGKGKTVKKNKAVTKLQPNDSKSYLEIINTTNYDFEQTMDKTNSVNSKTHKKVADLPKSNLKPTSTQEEDVKTKLKRGKDCDKTIKTTKNTKPRGNITKKRNKQNRCDSLNQIKKILQKLNTNIAPTYSADKKLEENISKWSEGNYFITTPIEFETSEEYEPAISNCKKLKNIKKARNMEGIVSPKPTHKRKRVYKDKLGNKTKLKGTKTQRNKEADKFKSKLLDLTISSHTAGCDESYQNLSLVSPKTISVNSVSDISTNPCGLDNNNIIKPIPKIILKKISTNPLDNGTLVLGATKKGDITSSCSEVDTNNQNNGNAEIALNRINKVPTELSKTSNPTAKCTNNEIIPKGHESKSELTDTLSKLNYAHENIQDQKANENTMFKGIYPKPSCKTAIFSKCALPNSLYHNNDSTNANDHNSFTNSTNMNPKTRKRAHSPLDTKAKKNCSQSRLSKKQTCTATRAKAAAERRINSKKKQESQEILPVPGSENMNYHIYNIISTITQNAFNPTIPHKNKMPQSTTRSTDVDLTSAAAQKMNLEKFQTQEAQPVLPTQNIGDLIKQVNKMTYNLLKSRLPKQNSVDVNTQIPRSNSSKQVNIDKPATTLLQQISLQRNQCQEQTAVATSAYTENNINCYSVKDSSANNTLRNQYETKQTISSNAADKSAAQQQSKLTRRLSREITPSASSDSINNYKNSFKPNQDNDVSFTAPKKNEVTTLLPNLLKSPENSDNKIITPGQTNSERTQFRDIPVAVASDGIKSILFTNTTFNPTLLKRIDKHKNISTELANTSLTDVTQLQLSLQRKQSQESPAAVTGDSTGNNKSFVNTRTHNNSYPTVTNGNYNHSQPQTSSSQPTTSTNFTSVRPQQFTSQCTPFWEVPRVVTCSNIENNKNSFYESQTQQYTSSSTLSKGILEHRNPQESSLKQLTKTAFTSFAPQQSNSERRETREIPTIVTTNNLENYNNSSNALSGAVNSASPKLHYELKSPQSSSKQSINPASTITTPQQIKSHHKQSQEIVTTNNDVKRFIDAFNAKKYNANNFPKQTYDLCHSEPSTWKQSPKEGLTTVAAPAILKSGQSQKIPPPDFIKHFKNYPNIKNTYQNLLPKSIVTENSLTVKRSDPAIFSPNMSNTHKLNERRQDQLMVNLNTNSPNSQKDYHLERAPHPEPFLIPSMLGPPQNSVPVTYPSPYFQSNSYESLIQKNPIQDPFTVKSNPHQEKNYFPHQKIGVNSQRMPSHLNSIPQNLAWRTNSMENGYKLSLEKGPLKRHADASRPPGLCNVYPKNVYGNNFPWIKCPPAWPLETPHHNPWTSLISTHQNSIQANLKRDIPSQIRSNPMARRNESIKLTSSPIADTPKRPTEKITTNKSQLRDPLSSSSTSIESSGKGNLNSSPPLAMRLSQEVRTPKESTEEIKNNKIHKPKIITNKLQPCDILSSNLAPIRSSSQADLDCNPPLEMRLDQEEHNSNESMMVFCHTLQKAEKSSVKIMDNKINTPEMTTNKSKPCNLLSINSTPIDNSSKTVLKTSPPLKTQLNQELHGPIESIMVFCHKPAESLEEIKNKPIFAPELTTNASQHCDFLSSDSAPIESWQPYFKSNSPLEMRLDQEEHNSKESVMDLCHELQKPEEKSEEITISKIHTPELINNKSQPCNLLSSDSSPIKSLELADFKSDPPLEMRLDQEEHNSKESMMDLCHELQKPEEKSEEITTSKIQTPEMTNNNPKPCDILSSDSAPIDNLGQADTKSIPPLERCLDQEEHSPKESVMNLCHEFQNPEDRSKEITIGKIQTPEMTNSKSQPCDHLRIVSAPIESLGRADFESNPPLEMRLDQEEHNSKESMIDLCHELQKPEEKSEEITISKIQTPEMTNNNPKPCDILSSDSAPIDSLGQADFKSIPPLERCLDQEEHNPKASVMDLCHEFQNPEDRSKEITISKIQTPEMINNKSQPCYLLSSGLSPIVSLELADFKSSLPLEMCLDQEEHHSKACVMDLRHELQKPEESSEEIMISKIQTPELINNKSQPCDLLSSDSAPIESLELADFKSSLPLEMCLDQEEHNSKACVMDLCHELQKPEESSEEIMISKIQTPELTNNKSQHSDLLSSDSSPIDSLGQADFNSNSSIEMHLNQEEHNSKACAMDLCHELQNPEESSEEIMISKIQTPELTNNKSQICDLLSSDSAPIVSLGQADFNGDQPLEIRLDQEQHNSKASIMDLSYELQKPEESSEKIMISKIPEITNNKSQQEHNPKESMIDLCHVLQKPEISSEDNKIQIPLKSCDHLSSSSSIIESSEQTDSKNNLLFEKCQDEEAQNSKKDVLSGDLGLNKPESALQEILLDKKVSTMQHNDDVQKQTGYKDDDDTNYLLSLIDSIIESP